MNARLPQPLHVLVGNDAAAEHGPFLRLADLADWRLDDVERREKELVRFVLDRWAIG